VKSPYQQKKQKTEEKEFLAEKAPFRALKRGECAANLANPRLWLGLIKVHRSYVQLITTQQHDRCFQAVSGGPDYPSGAASGSRPFLSETPSPGGTSKHSKWCLLQGPAGFRHHFTYFKAPPGEHRRGKAAQEPALLGY
jgi:hypothetical protein